MSRITSLPVADALRQLENPQLNEEFRSPTKVQERYLMAHKKIKGTPLNLPVVDALRQVRMLSIDDEARRLADVRALSIFSERTEIEAAYEEGFARGIVRAEARVMEWALERLIESGYPEVQARTILRI